MTKTDDFIPYVREIEETFIRLRRGAFILRPSEIQLIYEWFHRNIPAGVVTEAIGEMAERYATRHHGKPLSSLNYCRWHVEESFLKIQPSLSSPRKGKTLSGRDLLRRTAAAWKEYLKGLDRKDPVFRLILIFVEEMNDAIDSKRRTETVVKEIRTLRDALFTALQDTLPEDEQRDLLSELERVMKKKTTSLPPGMEETLIQCHWRDALTRRFHLPALLL